MALLMSDPLAASPQNHVIPGLAARKSAIRMLDAVLRRGEPLDQAQHAACQGLKLHADRALALAIASETLRHLAALDALIDSATQLILADDAKPRMVLRMMLVQALVLETPPHAIIAANLPLLSGGPKRLAHGVFGTLLRKQVTLTAPILPEAVAVRWSAYWGQSVADAAAISLASTPPLDLTLRDAADTQNWLAELGGESLMPGHIRLPRGTAIEQIAGFQEGAWWVQDLAASLPARLLGSASASGVAVAGRQTVLDLCAAPGGKTMQLVSNGWHVEAVDKSIKRLKRLEQNLSRTGMDAVLHQADLMTWAPEAPVDAILLDAPCSATGIFRRHPDVLYRVADRHIAELVTLQYDLLERVTGWLKPGGILVYAVCSLEAPEGEDQISAFLARHPDFSIIPVAQNGLPNGLSPSDMGCIRTTPDMLTDAGSLDGFFAARMIKAR